MQWHSYAYQYAERREGQMRKRRHSTDTFGWDAVTPSGFIS